MGLVKIKYSHKGCCEVCNQIKPVLDITVEIPVGYNNYDTEISICKECFNVNYESQ